MSMKNDYLVQVSGRRLREMEAAIDDDTYDAIDKIVSLQADLSKKDQEIEALESFVSNHLTIREKKDLYKAEARIKELEAECDSLTQQAIAANTRLGAISQEYESKIEAIERLNRATCETWAAWQEKYEKDMEGQKAYIGRLEAAYLKSEFWNLWHTGKYDDVEKANKKAEEALEKLRKG
jgi:chromosome segregation ATPase